MGWTDRFSPLDALDDLLARERALILAGDFDGLAQISGDKPASLAGLAEHAGNSPALDGLRRAAARNQDLLDAAARGLRAAQARIAALREPATSLRTYGRNGAASDLGGRVRGLSRRA